MNAGAKERRAQARGRTLGRSVLVPFGRLQKGLAVRAKPPAAVTAGMDMYAINRSMVGYQAAKPKLTAPSVSSHLPDRRTGL